MVAGHTRLLINKAVYTAYVAPLRLKSLIKRVTDRRTLTHADSLRRDKKKFNETITDSDYDIHIMQWLQGVIWLFSFVNIYSNGKIWKKCDVAKFDHSNQYFLISHLWFDLDSFMFGSDLLVYHTMGKIQKLKLLKRVWYTISLKKKQICNIFMNLIYLLSKEVESDTWKWIFNQNQTTDDS